MCRKMSSQKLRRVIIMLLAGLVVISLAVCKDKSNNVYKSENDCAEVSVPGLTEITTEKLFTIGGDEFNVDAENVFCDYELGFGVVYPDYIDRLIDNAKIDELKLGYVGVVYEYNTKAIENYSDSLRGLSEEKIEEKADKCRVKLFAIFRKNLLDGNDYFDVQRAIGCFDNAQEIGKLGGSKYYFVYNESFDNIVLTKKERKEISKIVSEMEENIDNICIFGDEFIDGEEQKNVDHKKSFKVGNFKVRTLDGEKITLDYIKNNKLTMINIWTTWCGACVEETPALANLAKNMLPDGVKLLSICIDGEEESKRAKEVLAAANAEFPVVTPDENLTKGLLELVECYPTTLFIDNEGNVVGEKIEGVPTENVEEYYLDEIEERLELLGD